MISLTYPLLHSGRFGGMGTLVDTIPEAILGDRDWMAIAIGWRLRGLGDGYPGLTQYLLTWWVENKKQVAGERIGPKVFNKVFGRLKRGQSGGLWTNQKRG